MAFKNFTQLQETCPCFFLRFTFHLTCWFSISLFHWDVEQLPAFFFLSLSLSVACIFHSVTLLAQFLLLVTCSCLLNLKPFFKPITHWEYHLFYPPPPFPGILLTRSVFTFFASVSSSASPVYASTPNRQISLDLTCFWDWHCGHSFTWSSLLSQFLGHASLLVFLLPFWPFLASRLCIYGRDGGP